MFDNQRIAIVGGGLAGIAAAAALAEAGFAPHLFEARSTLGGRAGSFQDGEAGRIDHCQHVAMGCCTNLLDLCRKAGAADAFRRDDTIQFYSPGGKRFPFRQSRWLPAPLHLAPAFLRLSYFSLRERVGIAQAIFRLARLGESKMKGRTIGAWLEEQRQSPPAIEWFWSIVLVSALGETRETASLAAARIVIVDGFLYDYDAYQIDCAVVWLQEL